MSKGKKTTVQAAQPGSVKKGSGWRGKLGKVRGIRRRRKS